MATPELLLAIAGALIVFAFIAWPLLGGGDGRRADVGTPATDHERLEDRIREYRHALRQGLVCDRCLYANPDASRFCAQCGSRLGAADVSAA